jgi:hypothetical protein
MPIPNQIDKLRDMGSATYRTKGHYIAYAHANLAIGNNLQIDNGDNQPADLRQRRRPTIGSVNR